MILIQRVTTSFKQASAEGHCDQRVTRFGDKYKLEECRMLSDLTKIF